MTCIVDARLWTSKKLLRESLLAGGNCAIEDPAIMPEWRKHGQFFNAADLKDGEEVIVTNHPKRSWFAQVGRKGGKLYVK